MLDTLECEIMKRDGFCRLCDKKLKSGIDEAVKFYSIRNRGQNIIICLECVVRIKNATEQGVDTSGYN